ncbi:MAG: AGE family epimerase/isomerase [Planctomycetota bacterium]|nr:AGE family epimerase/isomerase [Planctomycetota bacterium]
MGEYWTDPGNFRCAQVADINDPAQAAAAVHDLRLAVLCVLDAILRRSERDPGYGFIDTKLSLVTGRDFDAGDPVRGRGAIYGWIQGRGLEALAGHDEWIRRQSFLPAGIRESFHGRISRVLARAVERTEAMRARNGGHLFFMMSPEGEPLRLDVRGVPEPFDPPREASSMTDLFYVKGLAAAGRMLGREDLIRKATDMAVRVCEDIRAGRLYLDQQPLDPRNPARPEPGRFGNGGRMIAIGAAALFLDVTGKRVWAETGFEFITHMLDRHSNPAEAPACAFGLPFDMWEFVDASGRPWVRDGRLLSDPGHATEFVGLALKLIRSARKTRTIPEGDCSCLSRCMKLLPAILKRNFENGFSPRGFGIVKSFDLISRKPLNPQMPWWNLPETLRAAIEVWAETEGDTKEEAARIAARCSNAFLKYYVRKELNLMAVQTLEEDGSVVDVIPATPDADPGYHTGLCLIDCLDLLPAA